jgi:superfamily II DNA/RNA helicase
VQRYNEKHEESEGEGEKKRKQVFDSVKALIISPTRELAL